jgi:hypothetical protein
MAKAKLVFQPILLLLLVVSIFTLFSGPLQAAELKWSRVGTPSNGESGKWVLAGGSDIRYLTSASDGTLYCYANPDSTTYRLFKSSDNGITWSDTGEVQDNIIDIAIVPGKPDAIYYASEFLISRSTDAGHSFSTVARNPGGAGTGNVRITSIDVALFEGNEFVVIGTCDADVSQFGGVYLLDQSQDFELNDTSIGNYDVYSVVLAPDFGVGGQIVAVVTDEIDTIITTRFYNSGWGDYAGDARIPGLTPKSASVVFPFEYRSGLDEGKYTQFLALNGGNDKGDVYSLIGQEAPASSKIIDLDAGSSEGQEDLDITSLAVSGNTDRACLIAGAANSTFVYISEDSGANWISCQKPPTGSGDVFVSLESDFSATGVVFAATSGIESAFSISRDRGNHWSQLNLIDTTITNIKDLAVSPDYALDKALLLITGGTTDSLWRSSDGGLNWERIYSSALPQVNRINLVTISPNYSRDKTIILAGIGNSNPARWKSVDNGQSFQMLSSIDPQTGDQVGIDVCSITPDGTLLIGGYDGSKGLVYEATDSGLYYRNKMTAGNLPLNSMAVSPDYSEDKTVLAGNINGEVFYSDGGSVFKRLPLDAAAPPLSGNITIAFDPQYSVNNTLYAAGDTSSGGIFHYVIGESTSWELIDGSLPHGASISQVGTSTDGVIYGVYSRNIPGESNKGGLERSLDPFDNSEPHFETITEGVDEGVYLRKLWIRGRILWAVDSTGGRLLTYTDTLTSPIILISPEDTAAGLSSDKIVISWESADGATSYHWQVDTDRDFAAISEGFEGDTGSTSVSLRGLEPDRTYYWRVRAAAPVFSKWSETREFTAALNTKMTTPEIIEPESNVPTSLKPNFRWSVCPGATCYDLQVAEDEGFDALVIDKTGDKACNNNVWSCDTLLKYGTTYYWRARAVNTSNTGDWAMGVFTTEAAPYTLLSPSVPSSPAASFARATPTPISAPPTTSAPISTESSGLSNTLMRLVIFLGAGFGVLAIVLTIVVIYVLKKLAK